MLRSATMNQEQLIVSVVATLLATVILVLKPGIKWLWVHVQRPFQYKVQLAEQVKKNREYLALITHVSDHPRDLFLRLFRFSISIFLTFATAQVLFVLRGLLGDVIPLLGLCGLLIVLLSGVAFWESMALSAKNIATTKDRIQKSIAEAEAKLRLPS
jgi:hypothetical protein